MALRMSTMFLRTLREDPADAEVPSHRLLVRAGYIRRAAPGIYSWLPLGYRVLRNVERIVREEMDAIGAQEVHFPALLPREPYDASGRWSEYGDNIFRLKDRKEADYLLGPEGQAVLEKYEYGSASKNLGFKRWRPDHGISAEKYEQDVERWEKLMKEISRRGQ